MKTIAGAANFLGYSDGTNWGARFAWPQGLAVDNASNVFVADVFNHTIRKITPVGSNWVTTTIAGLARTPGGDDGTNSAARFNYPGGITVDAGGNLFVAAIYNHTVRRLTPVGTNWVVCTLAGLAGSSGAMDGTGPSTRFCQPYGVAVDAAGNLYVADTFNAMLRLCQPAISLACSRVGDQVILSWPLAASNYVLETSQEAAPGGTWRLVTDGLGASSNAFLATNAITAPAAFFRLRK